ncbi:MAG: hypothetical protein ACERKT_06220, partial [Acidobacteriota bacterium]
MVERPAHLEEAGDDVRGLEPVQAAQAADAEKVLVSVGRRAIVDEETIQALNLQMNGPAIAVNKKLETNAP